MKKLILFDIDGTLLVGSTQTHREAFHHAFNEVYNKNAIVDSVKHNGKTDKKIIIDILTENGLSRDDVLSKFNEAYTAMADYFSRNIDVSWEQEIGPGIEQLLIALKNKGHILGLVTGNLEGIAKLKMNKTGLMHFFEVGAFGSESEVRSDLVKNAVKRAEKKYGIINLGDVFVIGDSIRDIECSREAGVRVISVATGITSKKELEKHMPDYAFDNLADFREIIRIIEK